MKILKEPLLHFLLLGTAIFVAYGRLAGRLGSGPQKIVVTQGQIEALATTFARSWQRPPTASELDGLVREYVREEVASREAIALGLDRDDAVIRRRLRQKLEFVSEDIAATAEPTEKELRGYLEAHPDKFREEPRFTFRQVFLSRERRGENVSRDAALLLARLRDGGADADTAGDPIVLEGRFESVPASGVVRQFGEHFAGRLAELPIGQWQGPVASAFGAHLVFVSERTEGRLPALEEARDAVRREWSASRRTEANDKFYKALLKRYTVEIEKPRAESAGESKRIAQTTR